MKIESNKFKFTVKRLNETAKITVTRNTRFYDTEVNGLTAKLSPSGYMTYEVYKKPKGGSSPVTVTICQVGDMPLEEVRKKARVHLQTLLEGKNPNHLLREQTLLEKTLQDGVDWYAKTKTLNENSLVQYQRAIANYSPGLLSKKITDITPEEIISHYQKIATGQCEWVKEDGSVHKMSKPSPSQANLWARAMRAIINFGMDTWRDAKNKPIILENPVKVLSRNNLWVDVPGRTTRIADSDIGRFFETLDEFRANPNRRLTELAIADAIELALFTGLRLNEVLGLTKSQVDLEQGMMVIDKTKNKEPLELPLGPYVKGLLQHRFDAVPEHCKFLYPSNDGDKPIREVRKTVANLKKISAVGGLPELDLNFHDLRRSFVSLAVAEHFSPYLVKRLINHKMGKKTRDITEVYVHFSPEDLKRHVIHMEQAILRLAGRLDESESEDLDSQLLLMIEQLSMHQKSLLLEFGKQVTLVK
ncbi:tyrosine-type recombinase/integrase [Vibrio sp. WXL103]|uniref:tyrosine-type recombinase/integrase n=1 Tax=Vibrio sp. WXL103 TaxID=3450710 RepID=UPI003EC6B5DD